MGQSTGEKLIVGEIERLLRLNLRIGQGLSPIEFRSIDRQGLFCLLKSPQYRGVEACERCARVGFGLLHTRAGSRLIWKVPLDARADAPGPGIIRG